MIEEWKDIPEYEGLYKVSNLGNIKSLPKLRGSGKGYLMKEKLLKQVDDGKGYNKVSLYKNGCQKFYSVHALVAMAFLNHKPCGYKLVINHKDLNPKNNTVSNLEIVSQRENSNMKHLKTSSKYVGVSFHKAAKKWTAHIRIGSHKKYIGIFTNEIDAHLAYQKELSNI